MSFYAYKNGQRLFVGMYSTVQKSSDAPDFFIFYVEGRVEKKRT